MAAPFHPPLRPLPRIAEAAAALLGDAAPLCAAARCARFASFVVRLPTGRLCEQKWCDCLRCGSGIIRRLQHSHRPVSSVHGGVRGLCGRGGFIVASKCRHVGRRRRRLFDVALGTGVDEDCGVFGRAPDAIVLLSLCCCSGRGRRRGAGRAYSGSCGPGITLSVDACGGGGGGRVCLQTAEEPDDAGDSVPQGGGDQAQLLETCRAIVRVARALMATRIAVLYSQRQVKYRQAVVRTCA